MKLFKQQSWFYGLNQVNINNLLLCYEDDSRILGLFKNKRICWKIDLLCFDLLTRPKMPFKVMHRKEVTHSNGSYERKSRGRKLADEMGRGKKKSHDTLIDWRTGREWPLNCMAVISAWWRLNIRFQRSRGRSSVRWTIIYLSQDRTQASWVAASWRRNVVGKATPGRRGLGALMSWGLEKMMIRCRKESHHPAEWPLDLRLSIKRTRRTQRDGHNSGVKILQFMFGLQFPLTRKPWVTLFEPLQ